MLSYPETRTPAEIAKNYAAVRARLLRGPDLIPQKPVEPISAEANEPALVEIMPFDAPIPRITFSDIAREVCEEYKLTWIDIISARRTEKLTIPRQKIMWRARHETTLSFPQIGRKLNRDHSSVCHGVRKFQARIDDGEVVL